MTVESALQYIIYGPAITVDMFGNVVKGKINAGYISPAHIAPAQHSSQPARQQAAGSRQQTAGRIKKV